MSEESRDIASRVTGPTRIEPARPMFGPGARSVEREGQGDGRREPDGEPSSSLFGTGSGDLEPRREERPPALRPSRPLLTDPMIAQLTGATQIEALPDRPVPVGDD